MMVIVASMYGFFTSFVILRTIVLVDLLGLDKLTTAFGLLALFEGSGEFNILGMGNYVKFNKIHCYNLHC